LKKNNLVVTASDGGGC